MTAAHLNEYTLSEKPALDLFEKLGYTYIPGAIRALQAESNRLRELKRGLMSAL